MSASLKKPHRQSANGVMLFCLAPLLLPIHATHASVTYRAVLCGVSDYPGTANDLDYCDDDARDVRDALLASPNWDSANITLLIDSDATKNAIQTAIQDMAASADGDDICLFFFSGHGTTQVELWFPFDEADWVDEYLCAYDGDISDDEFGDWMASLPTEQYVVILDTCYSGGQIRAGNIKGIGDYHAQRGDGFAADLVRRIGTRDLDDNDCGVVLTACDDDEFSVESSSLANGVFTFYVVQGLDGPADDNNNALVSGEECYAYASPRTTAFNPRQHPQLYDGHTPGELGLVELEVAPDIYTITASAGSHGSIDPSGSVSVPEGDDQPFTAYPDGGYEVDTWYLDANPVQTGLNSYTIHNVQENHTLIVTFRLSGPGSEMTVLSPNGGETQCQGNRMSIAWQTTGNCGDVRLELLKGGSVDQIIDDSTPNDGSYSWRIPSDQQEGSDYRVRACCLSSGACDDSDGTFEILGCEPPEVIEIRNLNDLRDMSENWGDGLHPRNGHYVLTNDIDAGPTSGWNGGLGFKPIGTGYSDYFRGVFDGQGHRITGFNIDRPDEPLVGMFSVVMDSGTIMDLTLECEDLHGKGNGPGDDGGVGALVGQNAGTILNCHVIVEDLEGRGGSRIGGLVGESTQTGVILNCSASGEIEAEGDDPDNTGGIAGENSGVIGWCWAAGDVDGDVGGSDGDYVGGLVGWNSSPGTIFQSYSACTNVDGEYRVGGIAGLNAGTILDCYAQSWVDANNTAGGIAGKNEGTISRCYAAGHVDNTDESGGLVGRHYGSVSDSFWDTGVTGMSQAVGSGGGAVTNCFGLPTAEMKQQATYTTVHGADWDFDRVWWIEEGVNYPGLCGVGPPLLSPANLTASSGDPSGVILQWNAVSYEGECGPFYRVYRADSLDGTTQAVSDWQTQLTAVDNTATPQVTYYYWVKAAATTYNSTSYGTLAARESNLSNHDDGWRDFPPLDAPTGVSATDGLPGFVLVECELGAGASYYHGYRSDSAAGPKTPLGAWQTDTSFVDNSGNPETDYYYWVTAATNDQGERESDFGGPDTGFFLQPCDQDAECQNGAFCDGAELCEAGVCVDGPNPCIDIAHCDEVNDRCICLNDSECDDNQYCNGSETCDANGHCLPGTSVNCDDGVSCTADPCNEAIDSCENIPVNALCDNGLYCDGAETCHPVQDCQPGPGNPCGGATPVCDEIDDGCVECLSDEDCDAAAPYCDTNTDTCVQCLTDEHCDDEEFCNGVETCQDSTCVEGPDPCIDLAHCDEENDVCICTGDENCDDHVGCTIDTCEDDICVYTPDDSACSNGVFCDGVEMCNPVLDCEQGTPPCGEDEICDEGTDQCLPDCNHNGVPDDEDIAGGTSEDSNSNGIPDECDDCFVDTNCPDDGLYCTGNPVCVDWVCGFSGNPCPPGQTCNEASNRCIPPTTCPNGVCSADENCDSCPQDCGACHPADQPQSWEGDCTCTMCMDNRIEMCEAIGYAAAWLRRDHDDEAGAMQGLGLWMQGECYRWDEEEANWVPDSCE